MQHSSFFKFIVGLCFLGNAGLTWAQNHQATVQKFLNEHAQAQELSPADISDWIVTDAYQTKKNGITHLYIRQRYNGIEVFNGVANFNLNAAGEVLSMGNRLVSDLAKKVNSSNPAINPEQAIQSAAQHLGLVISQPLAIADAVNTRHFYYNQAGISKKEIPVKLCYWETREGEVRLAWDLSIYTLDAAHWWSMRIDAMNGQVLSQNDWVIHCNFGTTGNCNHPQHNHAPTLQAPQTTASNPDSYNVFALPVESPSHGSRSLVTNPANLNASPFGWHDTNGAAGAEYTITRGNNAYAYEDVDADDVPGFSPDGSATLDFNYPLNLNQNPSGYQDAAITNLFYMNNMMHDVWYNYGFDEESGNFQSNNYGNGGLGDDYVFAEAQDGSGTNNANFGTPPDGDNPTMQMYLWTGASGATTMDIATPSGIAGSYGAIEAGFGGTISAPINGTFVLVTDGTPDVNDACDPITNGAALSGKIAVIMRGTCPFEDKVLAAENEGAIAVVVMNNGGALVSMGGNGAGATIPSVMISTADGAILLAELQAGSTVTGTLNPPSSGAFDIDGDFDNGIISHEYGHGVSTRLTGGPANSDCLYGDEQMGEGWSDWFGIVLTQQPAHTATTVRPVGTFAIGEVITGTGIREAPYTTDMNVNPYTYDDTNNANLSVPHGVGFVWATMLWDLHWAFIAQYGYDPNLFTGTGGNNMVMQLVIDGLKLQPCDPGFVDGRDAILLADQNNNGGANQCLIWETFARRGLGYSASQGDPMSRDDQTEAFDLPPICLTPITTPTADFASALASSCGGQVFFDDNSTDIPQQWAWNFGDGNTSTAQNPSHTYTASGVYTVQLIVTNTLGADTLTQTVNIQYLAAPTTNDATICSGSSASLNANGSGTIYWYENGNLVSTGASFTTPILNASTVYEAKNVVASPSQQVGPSDNNFGTGGNHGSNFTGTVNFTANQALNIVSAWVEAQGAGNRTIYLWDAANGGGNVIDQVTINIPDGQGRITLDFQVPAAGSYSIGATAPNLYRNNAGAAYPYTIAGLISLTGSSAGSDFYYYLYDLEVQPAPCVSAAATATVTVDAANFNYTSPTATSIQFADVSVGASSWSWDFGDGNSSTQQNPLHDYGTAGTYTVVLTINGTCSISYQVTTGASSVTSVVGGFSAKIQPNPARDFAQLTLNQALTEDMRIEIIAADGRVIENLVLAAGKTQCNLPLQRLLPALYLVRMQTSAGIDTRKLVITAN